MIVSAIKQYLANSIAVDLMDVGRGIVLNKEHPHSAMVLLKLFLPYLVVGTVESGIIGLRVVVKQVFEKVEVLFGKALISALFNILYDDLLVAARGGWKLLAILERVIYGKKIHINNVYAVYVENQVAYLEKDHAFSIVGVNEMRLDNHAVHEINSFFSGLVNKSVLLLKSVEG